VTVTYRGLTWDHPRGAEALRRAVDDPTAPDCKIVWDTQPLEGFESAPICDNAARYDLLVLDHPHLGEALRCGALLPLDDVFTTAELGAWRDGTVGESFASYQLDRRSWALPLDAATQVSVVADPTIDPPTTWAEAVALADDVTTVLPTSGPHLFLTLCSIALANGEEPGRGEEFLTVEAVAEGLQTIGAFVDPHTPPPLSHNPIVVLEHMSRPGGPVYCPHVYGYVNYADASLPRPLLFADAPTGRSGRHGSVLGGTGIAISSRCRPDEDLVRHLRWLLDDATQTEFIPQHSGQPSAVAAWRDPRLDKASTGFYTRTATTIEQAWIRPRHDGAVDFQRSASAHVREAVLSHRDARRLAAELTQLHRAGRDRPHSQGDT
jgi:multiple sugar transport system substrate-binding protein